VVAVAETDGEVEPEEIPEVVVDEVEMDAEPEGSEAAE